WDGAGAQLPHHLGVVAHAVHDHRAAVFGDGEGDGRGHFELPLHERGGVGAVAAEVAGHHDRVHLAAADEHVDDAGVRVEVLLPRPGQVDGVGGPGALGQQGGDGGAGPVREPWHGEPVAGHRVGGDGALAAAVADDGDPVAGRERAADHQVREVDRLGGGLDEHRAGGPTGGGDDVGRGGERPGVGAGRGPAGVAGADREDDDPFARLAQPGHDPHEFAALAEALQVEDDGPGRVVRDEVGEQVGGGDVDLVADGDEPGDAEPRVGGEPGEFEPELAGLRHDRDAARDEGAPGEFQFGLRVVQAEAVRPDDAGAGPVDAAGEPLFQAGLAVGEVDVGGDPEEALDALGERLVDDGGDRRRRGGQDDELGHRRQVGERARRRDAVDDGAPGVDEVHVPAVGAAQRAAGDP